MECNDCPMLARLDALEKRVEALEGGHGRRLDDHDRRFEALEAGQRRLEESQRRVEAAVNGQTRTLELVDLKLLALVKAFKVQEEYELTVAEADLQRKLREGARHG